MPEKGKKLPIAAILRHSRPVNVQRIHMEGVVGPITSKDVLGVVTKIASPTVIKEPVGVLLAEGIHPISGTTKVKSTFCRSDRDGNGRVITWHDDDKVDGD